MSTQLEFRTALLDADLAMPSGLVDGQGRAAGRRYDVYRNNVAVSLAEALETGFPAVAKLIGHENFARAAGMFLRQEQPQSPVMMLYGAGFAEFLAGLEPLKPIGYLADVARLEMALRESYHAADAHALDPMVLQDLSEEALMGARLRISPAVRVLRSSWPVLSVYTFTMVAGSPKPEGAAQDVLIARPDYDPKPFLLPPGGAEFVEALLQNQTFEAALAAAGDGFELGPTLALLLQGGALTQLILS